MRTNLNLTQILTIFEFLSQLSRPAGIIYNKNDTVVWRNEASIRLMKKWYRQFPRFEVPSCTNHLQNSLELRSLKKDVLKLNSITQLPSPTFLEKKYELIFPGIGHIWVRDRFYRLVFGFKTYRIFENISSSIPIGIIRGD